MSHNKDIATKHFSGQAEGVTEQATFPIFPNERLLFGWPKVCRSRRTLYLDVDSKKTTGWCHPWSGGWMLKTAYKRRHINRHWFLCQQNRNHSMSSLPKFVLSALEDLVSISVLKVWQHFTCDDLVFQPWMATFRNDTHEDLSHVWRPPKSFDLMLHTSNTTVHLTKWCQGHLNGEETGQQSDLDFSLYNTRSVKSSTPL